MHCAMHYVMHYVMQYVMQYVMHCVMHHVMTRRGWPTPAVPASPSSTTCASTPTSPPSAPQSDDRVMPSAACGPVSAARGLLSRRGDGTATVMPRVAGGSAQSAFPPATRRRCGMETADARHAMVAHPPVAFARVASRVVLASTWRPWSLYESESVFHNFNIPNTTLLRPSREMAVEDMECPFPLETALDLACVSHICACPFP